VPVFLRRARAAARPSKEATTLPTAKSGRGASYGVVADDVARRNLTERSGLAATRVSQTMADDDDLEHVAAVDAHPAVVISSVGRPPRARASVVPRGVGLARADDARASGVEFGRLLLRPLSAGICDY
jgi:hypothetical protein